MALVQPPVAPDGQPLAVELLQQQVRRLDRSLQHRRVDHRQVQIVDLGEQPAGLSGLGPAPVGQADVDPAGEVVQLVPLRLAVADEDQVGHAPKRTARRRRTPEPGRTPSRPLPGTSPPSRWFSSLCKYARKRLDIKTLKFAVHMVVSLVHWSV